ncbi:hypothetical protein BST95_03155 [Halioglobus japonicus]|uniref:SPOR domain-containing protein n=1 Tax=Halioglobus japonicus TaxID=930805 RepID=A0AAP8MCI7_9GAMM|nr:SPOR domain-containing protein [Halioglobus japonicus]AQA17379.1 hypothetical protein BST95_03155 [Halioglobus japonicus]PLW85301.1 SPOR domain-containing protein [Halioglobus japonicus]GHD22459.1 hypothetical protein GCM10007052_34180 [Halioglobus japonicus]
MNNDKDRQEEQLDLDVGNEQGWTPGERLFDDFDDSDAPDDDRDTDHTAMFDSAAAEDDLEEDEPDYFDDLPEDQHDAPQVEDSWENAASEEETWDAESTEEDDPWDEEDRLQTVEQTTAEAPVAEPVTKPLPPVTRLESEQPEWDPRDDELDEGTEYYEEEEREITLPLGLILVGLVALVLLGAGGYGVMQQRAEMQEEIRRLQSNLATAANPNEVAETRANNEALVALNADLEAELDLVNAENRSLQAIVTGLEKQLAAQQDAMTKPEPAPPAKPVAATKPAPKPVARNTSPSPKPAAPTPTLAVESGTWFVNFGSYSQEQTAQGWARRLQPGAGKVVVVTGEKSGRTFYRVRVINLSDKAQADATARTLEARYDLPKLWVGQSS